ncbi:MAG: glutamine--tRNA ligase/YqeY domain fusion protein [Desulfobacteraceae bacterium]|nr:glutamine--tRNA ligase/YqeY domain fusion protein [Desulfobacteraceae bacterium]
MEEKNDTLTKSHFIQSIIENDIKENKNNGNVTTRFPPEPNGFLHIGHAKSMCLNFNMAEKYNGKCNLRFDDSNPAKEEQKYIDSIISNVKWLGFDYKDKPFFASDYFDKLHEYAVQLIKISKAYVCSLSADQTREYRGTLKTPGKNSPYRERSIEENLDLFTKMKQGEFEAGEHVLRAKIDMSSPNINLRDPVIYRVLKIPHPRTGSKWNIYPMYDFTHCLSDSIETITHSLCTLEFEDHRPLYDWILDELGTDSHPQQIEFARMNINFTVLSKRKLKQLVDKGYVEGWDDPRMPTLEGLRRRGFTPESIKNFCNTIGISKKQSRIDYGLLENSLRNDLNEKAPRRMGVLNPLLIEIENYPEGKTEELDAKNHPQNPEMGIRKVVFSKTIYIEKEDFMEDPPKKFFRLTPNQEVRLRFAYFISLKKIIKDEATGEIIKLICTYDPATKGGNAPDKRKVKGTLHWVSAEEFIEADVNLYDRLFIDEDPEYDVEDFTENVNPGSLKVLAGCKLEKSLSDAEPEKAYQFERLGYFCLDPKFSSTASQNQNPVFNRAVTLRDAWAKVVKQKQQAKKQKEKALIKQKAKKNLLQ